MGRRSRNRGRRRPERRLDPRLAASRVRAIDGEAINEEAHAIVVSPVELSDGRVLALHGPQVVAFNLVEAQRHARRGVKARRQVVGNLCRRDDGWWGVRDSTKGIDCIRDLATAVLFSFTALEGLGNHTIDQMEKDATVEVERDAEKVTVTRERMERTLSVSEKLGVVIPAFTGTPSLKGDAIWGKFVRLRRLRDGLVHPKNRGSNPLRSGTPDLRPDPRDPGIYGQLMRGDGDTCAEDSLALVRALRPEFLTEHVMESLGPQISEQHGGETP